MTTRKKQISAAAIARNFIKKNKTANYDDLRRAHPTLVFGRTSWYSLRNRMRHEGIDIPKNKGGSKKKKMIKRKTRRPAVALVRRSSNGVARLKRQIHQLKTENMYLRWVIAGERMGFVDRVIKDTADEPKLGKLVTNG
jgi:hypothetical protein